MIQAITQLIKNVNCLHEYLTAVLKITPDLCYEAGGVDKLFINYTILLYTQTPLTGKPQFTFYVLLT